MIHNRRSLHIIIRNSLWNLMMTLKYSQRLTISTARLKTRRNPRIIGFRYLGWCWVNATSEVFLSNRGSSMRITGKGIILLYTKRKEKRFKKSFLNGSLIKLNNPNHRVISRPMWDSLPKRCLEIKTQVIVNKMQYLFFLLR